MKKYVFSFIILFSCLVRCCLAAEWKEYKNRHFMIYYNNAPFDFVKAVAQNAERYYKEISSNLGFTRYRYWNDDERAQIYIYDNSDDFVNNGRYATWSAGTTHTQSKIIRTFPTAHGFFDSTLPHELGHIIFREFIGEATQVPLWFEEGVAMYQEKAKRFGANEVVRKAMANKDFISLKELSAFRPDSRSERKKVELFYAESASIVYYLIQEQGKSRFVRFCHKLRDGVAFEEALREVYVRFRNLEDLAKAWETYVKND